MRDRETMMKGEKTSMPLTLSQFAFMSLPVPCHVLSVFIMFPPISKKDNKKITQKAKKAKKATNGNVYPADCSAWLHVALV